LKFWVKMMEKYNFFYGNQTVEFERPKVSEIVAREGIKVNITLSSGVQANTVGNKYTLKTKSSSTKVVVKDVHNETK
jgi:hypothetical protein